MGAVMSTGLVHVDSALERSARGAVDLVREVLREARTPADVHEVRVRIEMARTWARVYKRTKDVRRELLVIEVAALVRMVELEGEDELPAVDREAALFLAKLTERERQDFVAAAKLATSAARLVKRHLDAQHAKDGGREFAARPPVPLPTPNDSREREIRDAREVAAAIIDAHVETGEPFSIADLVGEVLTATGRDEHDSGFLQGVAEMCRGVVLRSATSDTLEGTVVPKLITARLDDGLFVRIPTHNATIAHLDEALALKVEQLRQDADALERFREFVQRVKALPDALPTSTVGDLIAASLAGAAA